MKKIFLIGLFITNIMTFSQATTCMTANQLCGALDFPFQNTTGISTQGQMGCLLSTPNPTWFYFSVSNSGDVNLTVEQNTSYNAAGDPIGTQLDVDYVVYGPYSSPDTPCSGQLTPDKIVSCGYSASNVEYPSITGALTGQYYYLMVTNFSGQSGKIKVSQNINSGFVASLSCLSFKLNAFIDNNNNEVKDIGEPNFPYGEFMFEKNNDGIIHNLISDSGIVNVYEDRIANIYNFSYELDPVFNSYYNVTWPLIENVNIEPTMSNVYYFPITTTSLFNDVSITIVPLGMPIAGFPYKNKIIYTNKSNSNSASGTIVFNKHNLLTITNNTQSGTISNVNGFTFDYSNLMPLETRSMIVTFQVPTIPTVQLGDLIDNNTSISINTGTDVFNENNTSSLSQMIIGSYDPNNIVETHGEKIDHSSFTSNDYLYYTINFENTGTAIAKTVKLNNLLDNKLNEETIEMVASSHNYRLDRVGNNLNWDFKNIGLTPSSINSNGSKGFVVYKIKPKAGYNIGDIIPNKASIYFDYNPAIITNTFNTEFVAPLSILEHENLKFGFSPNPVKNHLTVYAKNNSVISSINIFDIYGKQILNFRTNKTNLIERVDLTYLSKGVYIIEVSSEDGIKMKSKLIVE